MSSPALSPPVEVAPRPWTLPQRIAFRFVFCYLVIFSLPFPLGALPGTTVIAEWWGNLCYSVVPWIETHVLGFRTAVPVTPYGTNGSGDTTADYVTVLCFLVLAALAAAVWSILDRRRLHYRTLHEYLRIYIRYELASIMLTYGMNKVIKAQFPNPRLNRLLEPYGNSSPMGLLWTFMGYSTAYTFFAGASEAVGALLLFLRRTTTLGALILCGVVTNVVLLNFAYDVDVKLFSMHLLLMTIFLLLPDSKRLLDFLVRNRAVAPAPEWRPKLTRRWRIAAIAFQVLFVVWAVYSPSKQAWEGQYEYGDKAPHPALYGIWDVDDFIRNGQPVPPLLTDAARWRRMVVQYDSAVTIHFMNDTTANWDARVDAAKKTLECSPGNGAKPALLRWSRPAPHRLLLEGSISGDPVTVRLHEKDLSQFLLLSRGFHWISEFPFNR